MSRQWCSHNSVRQRKHRHGIIVRFSISCPRCTTTQTKYRKQRTSCYPYAKALIQFLSTSLSLSVFCMRRMARIGLTSIRFLYSGMAWILQSRVDYTNSSSYLLVILNLYKLSSNWLVVLPLSQHHRIPICIPIPVLVGNRILWISMQLPWIRLTSPSPNQHLLCVLDQFPRLVAISYDRKVDAYNAVCTSTGSRTVQCSPTGGRQEKGFLQVTNQVIRTMIGI